MSDLTSDFHHLVRMEPGSVALADISEIASVGKDNVRASIFKGDAEIPILLKDVLYVPGLGKRLLSISAFTEACSIIVNEEKYILGHQHGKL